MPGSTTKAPTTKGLTATRRAVAATLAAGALLAAGCTGTSSTQVEVSAPEERVEATTTTLPPDCAEALPPAAQAAQMLMVMVTAPQNAAAVLSSGQVGGFGLKGRQSATVGDEVAAAITGAPVKPFVASDEEGGTVQRLRLALGNLPSAADMADGTPEEAATTMGEYAAEMVELGFNMNFGPVADVGSGSDLGTRSFGDDPNVVADFAVAIVEAQQRAGITSVAKHWPGIGGGSSDPHISLDALPPVDDLRSSDMVPFDRLIAAGVPAIMVAHATVPGLTGEAEPASLSRAAITDELRGRQRFDGLVITDSLGMGAVVNTVPQDEAAARAIGAGADIALLSGTDIVPAAHQALTEAISSGQIPADQVTTSVRRILAAKGIEGECLGLVASYAALLQNADSQDTTTSADGEGDRDTGVNSSDTGATGTGTGTGTETGTGSTGSSSGSGGSGGTASGGTASGGGGTGTSSSNGNG